MRGRRLEWLIWWFVFLSIVVWYSVFYINKGLVGLLTVLLLVSLALWQYFSKNKLPSYFISIIYGFIFLSVGMGTFGGLYELQGFDDFLHFSSGILAGYGGWIILNFMIEEVTIHQLPNAFIAIYLLSFVLAIAGLWELLEFAGDKLFHFTAQGRDPDDTMFDMIDGLAGGFVYILFLVRYRKKNPFY